MGYGNRPTMPNNGYQKSGFNKSYNQKKNNFNSNYGQKQHNNKQGGFNTNFSKSNQNINKNNNNGVFKSDDDIYTPKTYAKKPKEKSFFDDIVIPEYIEDRQRMRNKRENDKKYKNKNKRDY